MTSLTGKRVLVTGATGFIGSHLVRRLVDDGAEVHALTSNVSSVHPARLHDLQEQITLHEGNLVDRSAMDVIVDRARPSHVLHLGAYTQGRQTREFNFVGDLVEAKSTQFFGRLPTQEAP